MTQKPEIVAQAQPSDPGTPMPILAHTTFLKLYCASETTWDQASDSDEPYILFGMVDPQTLETDVERIGPFSDVDSGESRPLGIANQEAVAMYVQERLFLTLVLMEHDETSLSYVTDQFELGLVTATVDLDFEDAPDWYLYWNWISWVVAAIGPGDDCINAQTIIITPDGVVDPVTGDVVSWAWGTVQFGQGYIWTPGFQGEGAKYAVMIKIHK